MIKQQIYPKTQRMKLENRYQISEKIDGSNLGVAKINATMYLFLRNNVIGEHELEENKSLLYKGLKDWFIENLETLRDTILDGRIVFGEWISMGHLKYEKDETFNMFAKALVYFNISKMEYELENLDYDLTHLKYAFVNQSVPNCVNLIEPIKNNIKYLSKETLDSFYEEYTNKVNRNVEGFVIWNYNFIAPLKYVRFKRGKFQEHFCWELNDIKMGQLFVEKGFGVIPYYNGKEIIYLYSSLIDINDLPELVDMAKNSIKKVNKYEINDMIPLHYLKLIKMNYRD